MVVWPSPKSTPASWSRHHRRRRLYGKLDLAQPAVSKHLKVLRDSGFVSCRTAAQRRIYRIEPRPLQSLDAWLALYRQMWTKHLDALERHLDEKEPG